MTEGSWHPDPQNPALLRYWDGTAWTDHTAPAHQPAAPVYGGGYPVAQRTNSMAIAALVCAFVFTPLGIVFGHIALSQIKRSGGAEGGRGLALTGLILSYVFLAITVIAVIALVAFANDVSNNYCYDPSSGDYGYYC